MPCCVFSQSLPIDDHDLMKFVAPFNEVIEQMKIIRDSTPNLLYGADKV